MQKYIQNYHEKRFRFVSILVLFTLISQLLVTSYVSAASTLAETISKISQPVNVLQAPKDFNWAIPKASQSAPAKPTVSPVIPAKTTQKTTYKTPVKTSIPTKPVVTVVQTQLPLNFDAS